MQATRDTEPNPQEAADVDEYRPGKKTKLDGGSLNITEEVREEMADVDDDEDWDDIYGANQATAENPASMAEKEIGSGAVLPVTDAQAVQGAAADPMEDVTTASLNGPGTFAMAPSGQAAEGTESPGHNGKELTPHNMGHLSLHPTPEPESVEAKMEAAGQDDLVDETNPTVASTDEASTRMIQDTSALESDAPVPIGQTSTAGQQPTPINTDGMAGITTAEGPETAPDSDFESDDTSSDDSSDAASEGEEYASLNARDLARMLMKEEAGDGDNNSTAGGDRQPRTTNEVKPEVRPIPDIPMTAQTKITRLGEIRDIVEGQHIVINGGSGNTHILALDTPLCNEDREIIGVVCDVIGTQKDTFYTVAFNNEEEIEDFDLEKGDDVYYIDDHVKWEFAEHIRALGKGTDASNIHDEEVDFEEQDFSDDEKEAEYKRMNKASKKEGHGKLSREEFVQARQPAANDQPQRGNDSAQRGGAQKRGGDRGGRGQGGDRGGNRGPGGAGRGRGRGNVNTETIGGREFTRGAPQASATSARPVSRGDDTPMTQYPQGGLNYDEEPEKKPETAVADGNYNRLTRPDNYGSFEAPPEPEPGMRSRSGSNDFGNRTRGQGLGYNNPRGGGRGGGGRDRRGDRRNNDNRGNGRYQQGNRGPSHSFPDPHNNSGFNNGYAQPPAAQQQFPAYNNPGFNNGYGQPSPAQQQFPAWGSTPQFQHGQQQQYGQPPQQWPPAFPPQVQGYPPVPKGFPPSYQPPQPQMTPELVAQFQAFLAQQQQKGSGGQQ